MTEQSDHQQNEELNAWIKKTLNAAVYELMDRGLFQDILVEAKPAWVFPFTLLIGRVREKGGPGDFDWFISGDSPVSHVHSSLAATPRDAARHFALQWQLDAARLGGDGGELAKKAEALYELVEDSKLWTAGEPESR